MAEPRALSSGRVRPYLGRARWLVSWVVREEEAPGYGQARVQRCLRDARSSANSPAYMGLPWILCNRLCDPATLRLGVLTQSACCA